MHFPLFLTVILFDKSDTSTSSVSSPQISAMSRAQPTQQLIPFLIPVQMLSMWGHLLSSCEFALAQTDDPKLMLTRHSILNEFHWHSLKDRKSFAMCPLAFSGHMYRSVTAVLFSMLSTTSLILEYVQPKGL